MTEAHCGYDVLMDDLVKAAEEARLRARSAARRAAEAGRRREEIELRLRGGNRDPVERRDEAQHHAEAAHRSALEAHLQTAAQFEQHARELDARGRIREADRCRADAAVQRRLAEEEREHLKQQP
jgi:hypothetical protein